MHLNCLHSAKRVLVISCDRDVAMLIPALSTLESVLQQTLPTAELTVLTLEAVGSSFPTGVIEPSYLPAIDIISLEDWGVNPDALITESRQLVYQLRDRTFDAAIIFTTPAQSPYTWGYLCYLASIPIRIGQSQEFGGGVLSVCITPPLDSVSTSDYYLHLVRSLNFLTTPQSQLSLVS